MAIFFCLDSVPLSSTGTDLHSFKELANGWVKLEEAPSFKELGDGWVQLGEASYFKELGNDCVRLENGGVLEEATSDATGRLKVTSAA
eukprot:CAMPEP_0169422540 /NCGR_PEP_ID=MMETSP1017-20121227/67004_1 /TAXON_ID=342587 /ORGANISM="Karlodinium micrum, Strain CCMP2283" /LENGTH=87 /DNA_ID=CAMNT_0009532149 /DNA_START=33 /DNA_END=292 /DNA_ORIENTATION=-